MREYVAHGAKRSLPNFEFEHMKGFSEVKMRREVLMLFRKVKDKRAKRALENGNEEAPSPYQQIRNDKHVSVY